MAGNVQTGKAAAATNKNKYGDDFYSVIGSIGGKKKVPKGFSKLTSEQRKIINEKATAARWPQKQNG